MKFVLGLLAFSFCFSSFAQSTEQNVLERWEKQSPKNLSVLDAADAVTAFYKRKDPVFTAAAFLALSCAEQESQDSLLQTTDVLMNGAARRSLDQNISSIQVNNSELKKDGQQIAQEFAALQEVAVQKFFRSRLERVGTSQTTADCFSARTRTTP